MINLSRVFAMTIRYFLYLRHNLDRISDIFYWPAMELFVWGITGLYFASLSPNAKDTTFIIITGLVFWNVIWRAQYEINLNILAEMWDKNLVNIFASPLTIQEWIASLMLVGMIKTTISLIFVSFLALLLYTYSISFYGLFLIPVIVSLLLTGWAAGFFVAGLIVRFGTKIQTLAWTGVALIWPLSALYYPLSVLPAWAQKVALFLPSSYVFENLREVLFTGSFSYEKLLISFALNAVYMILSITFFVFMFNQSRKLGLGRLI